MHDAPLSAMLHLQYLSRHYFQTFELCKSFLNKKNTRKFKKSVFSHITGIFIKKKETKRKYWSRRWYLERHRYTHLRLLDSIRLCKELSDYENYFRISTESFDHILELISPYITKQDTVMRAAISPKEKLAVTLHYLATGSYFKQVRYTAIMSRQAISEAIMDSCEALIYALRNCIKMPSTAEEWRSVSDEFRVLHNFYNCIGAVDGKHVKIKRPNGSGALYYNYKGTYSIVLMAIANAKKEFVMVDIGCNGRVSDGGVLFYTKFSERLQQNRLNIPEWTPLPNTSESFPHVFIGDEAFALGPNIMKPYPQKRVSQEEQLFNKRLSKARCVIECAFGILANKFGVFQKAISLSPQKDSNYQAPNSNEYNFQLTTVQSSSARNSTRCAKTIRDKFCKYYNDEYRC
ncbi:protein ALP1-like [Rhagoletis pomonella]|uniref:protein ALP1-like n=1 Tax=Rhagoletis pomonella TaxID=28610 RepID=UPI00177BD23E|nr:protein ALP1-like [Rhagoletis pomonella]